MTYGAILDWAATIAGLVFMAFMVCGAYVFAWNDRRGAAHRVPLLALTSIVAASVALGGYGYLVLRRPFHVGEAWWAQGMALGMIWSSGLILWHGFGTCLKAFRPKPAVEAGVFGTLSAVHNNEPWTAFETRRDDETAPTRLLDSANDSASTT